MLEWGGFPGDTGICRIAWKGWKVMNDWNVRNVSGVSGTTGMSGMSGKTGVSGKTGISVVTGVPWKVLWLECLECPVEHTDGFLEDLLAFYA